MSKTVNITTTIVRHGKAKVKKLTNTPLLGEVQRAMAALLLDMSNTGAQVAAGLIPAQNGPFDQNMSLSMVVTHDDGTAHHSVELKYANFSQDGIDAVMEKVKHHLAPFPFA